MLLRRVIEHVREQNWTAVGIDFFIVVVGVFVGIQVSNWNEERETRQRGLEFTERLRVDLHDEYWVYEFLLAYYGDVRNAADRAVAALDGRAPLSNHDLLVDAYRATQYREGQRRRDTFDELVSTGSLGLIADQRLRSDVAQLYRLKTYDNLARESLDSPYRHAFRMLLTNDVQQELARRCGDRAIRPGDFEGMDQVIDYPCTLELPAATIDAAAQTLRSDPKLVRTLRRRVADLGTRLSDLSGNHRDVIDSLRDKSGNSL